MVGVGTLVLASVVMTVLNRVYERCMETKQISFAPLLLTCGTPNPAELAIGWVGTIASVGGLIGAIAISGAVTGYAVAHLIASAHRPTAVHLAVSTAAVSCAITAVLLMDPDSVANATGSGIVLTSAAAAAALLLSLGIGGAIRVLVSFRQRKLHDSDIPSPAA